MPDHLKTQEMSNKVVEKNHDPDRLRTQKMWDETVRNWPWSSSIPDHLRTQKRSNKKMRAMLDPFQWISERFKKQAMW